MKSARGRDQAGLAAGPATSPSGWSVPRLHNRAHRTPPPTTFRLRFPEGSWVLTGERRPCWGFSEEVEPNSQYCVPAWGRRSPAFFPQRSTSFGHLLSPYLASKQLISGGPRGFLLGPCACSASGGHQSARYCRPARLWIAECSPSAQLRAPPQSSARGSAGDRRLPARMGGV